jgi:glutamine amidotransferase
MNKNIITIIDYNCGNIFSLIRILEKLNIKYNVSNDPKIISKSDKLILPGVGSFSVGIDNLKKKNIDESIKKFVEKGNWILGICLGMQLLVSNSEEFGDNDGLDLIKGEVKKLKSTNKKRYKIPHVGWNSINFKQNTYSDNFLKNVKNYSNFYFTHSFAVKTKLKDNTLAETIYSENSFSSIISKENILGVQFHPEKSGIVGEKMIRNFLNL